jgi:hypothetical protein
VTLWAVCLISIYSRLGVWMIGSCYGCQVIRIDAVFRAFWIVMKNVAFWNFPARLQPSEAVGQYAFPIEGVAAISFIAQRPRE